MNSFELSNSIENAMQAMCYASRDYTRADWKYEKLKEEIEAFLRG